MSNIIDLPYQNIIDRSSTPTMEGYMLNEISYGGKISQKTFDGPSVDASQETVFKVVWKLLKYATPEEVLLGEKSSIDEVKDFYKQAQINKVRWKPFEYNRVAIWEIVPNSLTTKNYSGCNFEASLSLKFLYYE